MIIDGDPTPQFARFPVALLQRAVQATPRLPGDALYILAYLHSLSDHRTGELPKDAVYHHADAAEWSGFPLSTVRAYVAALEQAKLLTTTRVYRGLRFRILGITTTTPGKRSPTSTSPSECSPASTNNSQVLAPQRISADPPALPIDSEDSEKNHPRGGRGMVGGQPPGAQPAPLTPPDVQTLAPFRDTIRTAQKRLRRPLEVPALTAIASALHQLHDLDERGQAAAILGAAEHIAAHPDWNPQVPALWADSVIKCAAAQGTRPGPKRRTGPAAVAAVFARQGIAADPAIAEEMRRVALR